MSKLSIIVPVYYNADTLELLYADMKEKILHKLGDYEIVFVDDGSGDGTVDVAEGLVRRYPTVRVLRNPHEGVSAARNRGIREARPRGQWDEWLDPEDRPASS